MSAEIIAPPEFAGKIPEDAGEELTHWMLAITDFVRECQALLEVQMRLNQNLNMRIGVLEKEASYNRYKDDSQ